MAHPPDDTSELSFDDFFEACARDGRRHIKLDFKELAAVEPCIAAVAAAAERLAANGQTVWLNADVLSGPNRRRALPLRAESSAAGARFLALAAAAPACALSLGWVTHPVGRDAYTEADARAMRGLLADRGGDGVVFAAAARIAARDPQPLVDLLRQLPTAQLLCWTGTGEPPVPRRTLRALGRAFYAAGVADRVGYDCNVARSFLRGLCADLSLFVARFLGY